MYLKHAQHISSDDLGQLQNPEKIYCLRANILYTATFKALSYILPACLLPK
jgi:hypothetical protein